MIENPMTEQKNNPTVLVILGITGDLAAKKIIPALFNLFEKDQLPSLFQIVGFSRRDWSDINLKEYVTDIISKPESTAARESQITAFANLFSYQQGQFEDIQGYSALAEKLGNVDGVWKTCSNKLFYLSVPPENYANILQHLHDSKLTAPCGNGEEGWTRVLVEKPFGNNAQTAEELDELLARLFQEQQIYRIDHYLAKEMVQNILAFRFSNDLFEGTWNNQFIEKIDIRLWETLGVENRGSFYDGIGALRDVGQNHLLQMLALATMEHPQTWTADTIRTKRADILETLQPLTIDQITKNTFRAQYSGYKTITGVNPDSNMETYFKVSFSMNNPRWQQVPISIESGKRLSEKRKDIIITFKHSGPCLCPPGEHLQNKITFSIEPDEKIIVDFWAKKPGLSYDVENRRLEFSLRESTPGKNQYVEEYEKLIIDGIAGDQTLFVSTREVRAMWKFIDPIVEAWHKNAVVLKNYSPNTNKTNKIGVVGLGKMGANIARRLIEQGWQVYGYNRTYADAKKMETEGLQAVAKLPDLIQSLPTPRVIWLMVPAGSPVDDVLFGKDGIAQLLSPGDTIIDGGNSFYRDSVSRHEKLAQLKLHFLDVGVSGGPNGARQGASLMIGGNKESFSSHEALFKDLAQPNGYQFFEGAGAGHFVKMVHNGIEYGMMQAIAEGFAIMKQSPYYLDLTRVANIYNHGSVVESKLMTWLQEALVLHGQDLKNVSGTVAHTGEGQWTAETADLLKVKAEIIKMAVDFRVNSKSHPSYTGQVLSALRGQFGGHDTKSK